MVYVFDLYICTYSSPSHYLFVYFGQTMASFVGLYNFFYQYIMFIINNGVVRLPAEVVTDLMLINGMKL